MKYSFTYPDFYTDHALYVDTIKAIRELFGYGLKEAVDESKLVTPIIHDLSSDFCTTDMYYRLVSNGVKIKLISSNGISPNFRDELRALAVRAIRHNADHIVAELLRLSQTC